MTPKKPTTTPPSSDAAEPEAISNTTELEATSDAAKLAAISAGMEVKATSEVEEQEPEATPAFQVSLTEEASQDLAQISDTATREAILRRTGELQNEPMKLGKKLTGDLKNFRSLRAAGQRYRIVYQVAVQDGLVVVVVIGIRKDGDKKDAYAVAGKRLG